MNIVEFYKKLSKLLEDFREKKLQYSEARSSLDELLIDAKGSKLDVNISHSILDFENLANYDDENSYEEYDSSYDSSYNEEDSDSSY